MWTAFLEEQSLSEGLSSGNVLGRRNDRGVESYDIPEEKEVLPENKLVGIVFLHRSSVEDFFLSCRI